MWAHEPGFTLLQRDGCIRVRRAGNKMLHPACLLYKSVGQHRDRGQLLLIRFRFSNVIQHYKVSIYYSSAYAE